MDGRGQKTAVTGSVLEQEGIALRVGGLAEGAELAQGGIGDADAAVVLLLRLLGHPVVRQTGRGHRKGGHRYNAMLFLNKPLTNGFICSNRRNVRGRAMP